MMILEYFHVLPRKDSMGYQIILCEQNGDGVWQYERKDKKHSWSCDVPKQESVYRISNEVESLQLLVYSKQTTNNGITSLFVPWDVFDDINSERVKKSGE